MSAKYSRLTLLKRPKRRYKSRYREFIEKMKIFWSTVDVPDFPKGSRGPSKSLSRKQCILSAITMHEFHLSTYEDLEDFLGREEDIRAVLRMKDVPDHSTLQRLINLIEPEELATFNHVFRTLARNEHNDDVARDGTGFTIGIGTSYQPKQKASLEPWMGSRNDGQKAPKSKKRKGFTRTVIDVNVGKKYVPHFAVGTSAEGELTVAKKLDENYPAGSRYRNAYADALYEAVDELERLAARARDVRVDLPASATIRLVNQAGDVIRNRIVTEIHGHADRIMTKHKDVVPLLMLNRPIDGRKYKYTVGSSAWKRSVDYGRRSIVECIIGCIKRLYGFFTRARKPENRLKEVCFKLITWNFRRLSLK